MTKKQFGIIFTLLALIVCTAVLAAKLNNGGLNDPSDLGTALLLDDEDSSNEKEQETVNQKDYFYETRSVRETKDASSVQTFKSISESTSATAEQKKNANDELAKIAKRQEKEKTIETNIKGKGFEDVLCEISEKNKVNIVVKTPNEVTSKDTVAIQEIVYNASGINDVSIEVKK